jgi:hypothetical protein
MSTPSGSAPETSPATTGGDWTVQVADTIESVVGSVRNKTAVPLETVARGLVYGILIAVMGITALVLVTILSLRVLTIEISGRSLPVYGAYAILGGLFSLVGLFLWRKRRPRSDPRR